MENVLVVGSGGREHALAEALKRDREVNTVFCAPGNGGTESSENLTNLHYKDFQNLYQQITGNDIGLVVVGPEKPLAEGISDFLRTKKIPVFGFEKKTAKLEASKGFADEFKKNYGVSSPDFETFTSYHKAEAYLKRHFDGENTSKLWIKADELCGGKGVIGVNTLKAGKQALNTLLKEKKCGKGEKVIIQEDIPGEEITVQSLTDGQSFVLTPSSQDHKQLYKNDKGPNTGGMGAYAPAPTFRGQIEDAFQTEILSPTANGLTEEDLGGPGVLYFGLRLSSHQVPKVLEYNVRFGDPETQAILRLLDTDLYPILKSASEGRLPEIAPKINWKNQSSICVILSVKGYPLDYGQERYPIEGLRDACNLSGVQIYHSGTRVENGVTYTDGGRILSVTATGDTLEEAQTQVYRAIEKIHFQDMYYRTDIGYRALQ